MRQNGRDITHLSHIDAIASNRMMFPISYRGVRFIGGWSFTDVDAQSRLLAEAGYCKGAAMAATSQIDPRMHGGGKH